MSVGKHLAWSAAVAGVGAVALDVYAMVEKHAEITHSAAVNHQSLPVYLATATSGMFILLFVISIVIGLALAPIRRRGGGSGASASAWEAAPKVSGRAREYQGW